MKFEKIVDKIYNKLYEIQQIEEQTKIVTEIAMELGLDINHEDINIDVVKGTVILKKDISDNSKLYEKLLKIAQYIVGKDLRVSRIELVISLIQPDELEKAGDVESRARELGLEYLGYKKISDSYYEDYVKIDNNVYLVIENYKPEDC